MKQEPPRSRNADIDFLLGGGEMAALMREKDWSQTLLGPVENWSQQLRTVLSLCLNSRFPMVIWWGKESVLLYNNAWRPILGTKHPQSLGKPGQEVWAEIWDIIGVQLNGVLTTGQATWSDDLLLNVDRYGYIEEAYFTYSYSPIFRETGEVEGAFTAVTETTRRVIGERRLSTLRELAANTVEAKSVQETCRIACTMLANNLYDIPFALLYLVEPDSNQARLVGTTGIEAGTPASLEQVDLTQTGDYWQLSQVNTTGSSQMIEDLCDRLGNLPGGAWEEPSRSAIVLPIAQSAQKKPLAGLLVLGISPRREFDDEYRGFFDLVANQVTTAIANAQAYEEERKRAEALAELDHAKTVFFSNVSHEFRTPLTLMLGPLEEALSSLVEVQDTGTQKNLSVASLRENLQMVQRNGLRLLKLVNTLLDFSRIEAGRVQASYEPTDLAAFTADLASVFRSAIAIARMQLSIDCPPLPEPVYVDREMWEKIVLNLLSNAFKFTFEGEITVSLRLLVEHEGGEEESLSLSPCIVLEVRDTGTGIPTAEIPHLFERFHRVKGAQGRTFEGSGIGLSLVKELVQMHGGTIHVTSVLGEGSCFTVSIPAGSAHLPQDRINAARTLASTTISATPYLEESLRWLPPSPLPLPPSPSPTAHILLADDNADMRDYVKRLLSQHYAVEAVSDGLAALSAIRESVPDLVLTDVMMPELDGFELLQTLRSEPQTREIPIILLSARAGEEARVQGLEAGADDYLIKPFSARELLARVEATLKLSRLRRETAVREQLLRTEAETVKVRLESVLAGINDQFIVLDREWRYTFINDQVLKVTGKTKEELLGKNIWEVFPDQIGTKFYTQLHCAVAQQEGIRVKLFYPPLQRWFENRIYPFTEGVTVFVSDISDRLRTAKALRQREAELRLIANAIPALIAYVDTERCYRFTNQSYEDWFGHPVTEITGKHLWEVLGESAYQEIRPYVEQVLAGQSVTFESQVPYQDGGVRYVRASYIPRYDSQGQIEGFVALVMDISDRKQAELALRQSEERFRNMADNAPVMIWVTDATGSRTYLSRSWYEFSGQTEETGLGLGWLAVVHPDDRELVKNTFLAANKCCEPFRLEYRLQHKDGEYRWMIDAATPWLGVNGQFKGYIGSAFDITERKTAEAERAHLLNLEQAARAEAERANRIKDEFLAVLSHELRSPLNPILGWAKLLQSQKLDEATHQQALSIIERNAQLQAQLIEDLLDVSRILRGKINLNPLPVNLASLVRSAIETVRLAAEAKSIEIQTNFRENLGLVRGDPVRLQQIAWNLLSNAVKFTPKGGRVVVRLERVMGNGSSVIGNVDEQHPMPESVQMTVTDTGKGITPNFLPYVFEYFRQADSTTTRKFGGLGLGLAIVRYLVELHGGTVRAESPGEGQGATFTVRLPLFLDGKASPVETPAETPTLLPESLPLANISVLVVDDEPDTRHFLAFVLENSGASVTAVASAGEALQILAQSQPDILLSDIGMPKIDGYRLMQLVRALEAQQQRKPISAIALSAYAGELDRQRALNVGFQRYLTKPVDPEVLVKMLCNLIHRG